MTGKPFSDPGRNFWDRMTWTQNGCLEWDGPTNKRGYGYVSRKGLRRTPMGTHRLAWWLTYGDPGPMHVLHHCDNPPCCNPEHLFLGLDAENVADMIAKGRGSAPPIRQWEQCPYGHPYTPENRYSNGPNGKTRCALCARATQRERYRLRTSAPES